MLHGNPPRIPNEDNDINQKNKVLFVSGVSESQVREIFLQLDPFNHPINYFSQTVSWFLLSLKTSRRYLDQTYDQSDTHTGLYKAC